MNTNMRIPSAPMKPSREATLWSYITDMAIYGNVDCYCDEDAVFAELASAHNYRPTDEELVTLFNKYSCGERHYCVKCAADMGKDFPHKYCMQTYCESHEY